MRQILFVIISMLLMSQTGRERQEADPKLVGGRCEGCEAVFEFGERQLAPVDTLPDFAEAGPKLKISGTVYQPDGKTPAAGVILYIYHTDQSGIYPTRGNESGWARRHGYLRGWVKTGADGQYAFYTRKPASYPSRSQPAHIHATILEPNGKYYWIEEYLFDDDLLLRESHRNNRARGGSSGVITLGKAGGMLTGERDIILGANVPGYE